MGSFYSCDHIARDHFHTDITACNIEEPQQKNRLETVSNGLPRVGRCGFDMFYWYACTKFHVLFTYYDIKSVFALQFLTIAYSNFAK